MEVIEVTQILKEVLFFVWQFTMIGMVCLSFSITRFLGMETVCVGSMLHPKHNISSCSAFCLV